MTALERHKKAVAVLSEALRQYTHPDSTSVCDVLALVEEILNPQPKMSEVEVERFVLFHQDGTANIRTFTRDEIQGLDCKGGTLKRVTHTVERPVRQLEKSASVPGIQVNDIGQIRYNSSPMIEFPEAKGKTGVLTFTWSEPV